MGKIVTNILISLDGYIAELDGGYDWVKKDEDSQLRVYGGEAIKHFDEFIEDTDTICMGRVCYEKEMYKHFTNKDIYVVSPDKSIEDEHISCIEQDQLIESVVRQKEAGKSIYLFGGSKTIAPFIERNLIDQYNMCIVPVFLGQGRKMSYISDKKIYLNLVGIRAEKGMTILKYERKED